MYVQNELIFSSSRPIEIRKIPGGHSYRVEWLIHNHKVWEELTGFTHYHCLSARLDPYTCVEGSKMEMDELCTSILKNEDYSKKRCAVLHRDTYVGFYSPRNSNGRKVFINKELACEAARRFHLSLEK